MAQARPLSNVGSRTSFFAAFHSLVAVHTSNRLNHALASPSSKGSGKHIMFPVAIVPGFGTTVTARKNNPENSHNSVITKSRGHHVSDHETHYTHTQSIIYPITSVTYDFRTLYLWRHCSWIIIPRTLKIRTQVPITLPYLRPHQVFKYCWGEPERAPLKREVGTVVHARKTTAKSGLPHTTVSLVGWQ